MMQYKNEINKSKGKHEEVLKLFDALKKSMRLQKVQELEQKNTELERYCAKLTQLKSFPASSTASRMLNNEEKEKYEQTIEIQEEKIEKMELELTAAAAILQAP